LNNSKARTGREVNGMGSRCVLVFSRSGNLVAGKILESIALLMLVCKCVPIQVVGPLYASVSGCTETICVSLSHCNMDHLLTLWNGWSI